MNLNHNPFLAIKSKTKTIEMRLYDEKRKLIKPGDLIEFTDRKTNETIMVVVSKLHICKNFNEIYATFNKISLGYTESETANPEDMELYYSKSDIEKFGVVGIEIKLL